MRLRDLFEVATPRVAYHGTSVEHWAKEGHGDLYVAMHRETAEHYASEWREEDLTPLLIEIDLTRFQPSRFEPNWETVQQHIDMGEPIPEHWRYTAEHFGTFVIAGFSEADKANCRTHLLESANHDIRCRREGGRIIAWLDNREVGWFSIADHADGTYSLHANVDMFARRMGVSTFVYDWAEANLSGKLVPYDRLSPEALQFWQKRSPGSVDDYIKDGANYYSPAGVKRWL